MAVTLTLTDEIDVSRGDVLVHPANLPRLEQTFEAMVVWMAEEPLLTGRQFLIKQATNTVAGQVAVLRYRVDVNTLHREPAPALGMNEVGRCMVSVSRPICFDPYAHNRATGAFIFVDRLTNRTVGAGMIVDRATSLKFLQDFWDADSSKDITASRSSIVSDQERCARFGQRPVTLLLTGLSGSGKTTIAYALERRLFDLGHAVGVLDGRRMRQTISRDLGFSAQERSENLRRSIDVARLINEAGLICVCAFVAPSAAVREKARASLGADRFIEVYLAAPVETCRERDREGMYARADSGDIPEFPGVSGSYDVPAAPDLTLHTDRLSAEECVGRIVELLHARGVLG